MLRRANGNPSTRSHGGELYATRAQLSMEEQLLADAQVETALHLPREQAAALLGADLAQLQAQLHAGAPTPDGATQGGLRLDQATAAFLALTSPRRAELIVGPAGTAAVLAVAETCVASHRSRARQSAEALAALAELRAALPGAAPRSETANETKTEARRPTDG